VSSGLRIVARFDRHGILAQLGNIALLLYLAAGFMRVVVWVGNPYADRVEAPEKAASAWMPPPGPMNPPLPPGFPYLEFSPPLVTVPERQPPVPTPMRPHIHRALGR
jgi:hypothetical protein